MRLATTGFSFTNEWLAGRYTLERLLNRVAELELGPGIELVGHQTWRSFPVLRDEDVLDFRHLVDEFQLEPAALGGYVDLLRRVDRPMTTDEATEVLSAQIAAAEALGFPVVRLHAGVPVAVLERVAAIAERAGVVLATEIQGGQTPSDPVVTAVLECCERLGSPSIALTLDFSVAMTRVPKHFVDAVCRAGMAREALDNVVALWEQGARTPDLLAALAETGAPAAALDEARSGFVRFGRQEPEAWLSFVPHVAYVHAKFWELDDDGDEPTVRNAEMIAMLRAGGYAGFVCSEWGGSEWGGSAWVDASALDAFDLTGQHHLLLSRLIVSPDPVQA
jgi:hypothetical protein